VQDLLGVSVEVAVDILPRYIPHLESGKMPRLGGDHGEALVRRGGYPTMREAGFPGYQPDLVCAVRARRSAAGYRQRRSKNRHINEYIKSADGNKRLADAGAHLSAARRQISTDVKNDMAKWGPIIQKIGIRLD